MNALKSIGWFIPVLVVGGILTWGGITRMGAEGAPAPAQTPVTASQFQPQEVDLPRQATSGPGGARGAGGASAASPRPAGGGGAMDVDEGEGGDID